MSEKVIQIQAPHFTAAVVIRDKRCIAAAPILKWAVGQSEAQLIQYFGRKGWDHEESLR